MKRLIASALALFVVVALSVPLFAQHGTNMDRMAEELGLTQTQKEEITALREAHKAQMKAWREANLTPEQQEKMRRMMADRREGRQGHGGREAHVDRMSAALDLTDDQVTKMKEIRSSARATADAWFEANGDASSDDRHAFMKAHRTSTRQAVRSVLSESQQEKFDTMRGREHHGHQDKEGHHDKDND